MAEPAVVPGSIDALHSYAELYRDFTNDFAVSSFKVGFGAFGIVYRCHPLPPKQARPNINDATTLANSTTASSSSQSTAPVCVKIVPNTGKRRPTMLFLDEGLQLKTLNALLKLRDQSAFVVKYYRFNLWEEKLFVLMEECRGPDLRQLLSAKKKTGNMRSNSKHFTGKYYGPGTAAAGVMVQTLENSSYRAGGPNIGLATSSTRPRRTSQDVDQDEQFENDDDDVTTPGGSTSQLSQSASTLRPRPDSSSTGSVMLYQGKMLSGEFLEETKRNPVRRLTNAALNKVENFMANLLGSPTNKTSGARPSNLGDMLHFMQNGRLKNHVNSPDANDTDAARGHQTGGYGHRMGLGSSPAPSSVFTGGGPSSAGSPVYFSREASLADDMDKDQELVLSVQEMPDPLAKLDTPPKNGVSKGGSRNRSTEPASANQPQLGPRVAGEEQEHVALLQSPPTTAAEDHGTAVQLDLPAADEQEVNTVAPSSTTSRPRPVLDASLTVGGDQNTSSSSSDYMQSSATALGDSANDNSIQFGPRIIQQDLPDSPLNNTLEFAPRAVTAPSGTTMLSGQSSFTAGSDVGLHRDLQSSESLVSPSKFVSLDRDFDAVTGDRNARRRGFRSLETAVSGRGGQNTLLAVQRREDRSFSPTAAGGGAGASRLQAGVDQLAQGAQTTLQASSPETFSASSSSSRSKVLDDDGSRNVLGTSGVNGLGETATGPGVDNSGNSTKFTASPNTAPLAMPMQTAGEVVAVSGLRRQNNLRGEHMMKNGPAEQGMGSVANAGGASSSRTTPGGPPVVSTTNGGADLPAAVSRQTPLPPEQPAALPPPKPGFGAWSDNPTLTFDFLRRCMSMMASAVAAVHAAGILHRDLKIENFRFRDLDLKELVLLDFGLSRLTEVTNHATISKSTAAAVASEEERTHNPVANELASKGAALGKLASSVADTDKNTTTGATPVVHVPAKQDGDHRSLRSISSEPDKREQAFSSVKHPAVVAVVAAAEAGSVPVPSSEQPAKIWEGSSPRNSAPAGDALPAAPSTSGTSSEASALGRLLLRTALGGDAASIGNCVEKEEINKTLDVDKQFVRAKLQSSNDTTVPKSDRADAPTPTDTGQGLVQEQPDTSEKVAPAQEEQDGPQSPKQSVAALPARPITPDKNFQRQRSPEDLRHQNINDKTADQEQGLVGTLCNLAPEILQDRAYSEKSDLWALGTIFYELLVGATPFDVGSYEMLADLHRDPVLWNDDGTIVLGRTRRESRWWKKAGSSAQELVTGLLRIEIAERIASAKAVSEHGFFFDSDERKAALLARKEKGSKVEKGKLLDTSIPVTSSPNASDILYNFPLWSSGSATARGSPDQTDLNRLHFSLSGFG
ncbi:unnamed protein product [Amoebophrya sp. A120]|nr:unnamed protein product [Amoebophrya sp. A120]|eukprot:GSA120T00010773001.1